MNSRWKCVVSPGFDVEGQGESLSVAFQLDFAVGASNGRDFVFVDDWETQSGGELQLGLVQNGGLVEVEWDSLAKSLLELLQFAATGGQQIGHE